MKRKIVDMSGFEVHLRYCQFCGDELPINTHELRKLCPAKFGMSNYCKYKYKDLVQQQRLIGADPILTLRDGPQKKIDATNATNLSPSALIDPMINLADQLNVREKNIQIIRSFLHGEIETKVDVNKFYITGYDDLVFDAK